MHLAREVKQIYLSYELNAETPSYGNKSPIIIEQTNSMASGATSNNSVVTLSMHLGTHIDFPFHFFKDGQTLSDYPINFWRFLKPLLIETTCHNLVMEENIIEQLDPKIIDKEIDLLLIKTGQCYNRSHSDYWNKNYGIGPKVAEHLRSAFPYVRAIGFDSISLSSYQHRELGREAHRAFLNPSAPILIIEDMDLREVNTTMDIKKVHVAPLRVHKADGAPCTIWCELND